MSSLQFSAEGEMVAALKPVLALYGQYKNNHGELSVKALNSGLQGLKINTAELIDIPETSIDWHCHAVFDAVSFSIFIEGSTTIDASVYHNIISTLEALHVKNWQASFFESQTGFSQSWLFEDGAYFDTSIDFDDCYVFFVGDMQEDDLECMQEEAEDCGVLVQESLDDQTQYLIVGEQVEQSLLDQAKDQGVKVLTEKQYLTVLEGVM